VAAVNSALQRARATLGAEQPERTGVGLPARRPRASGRELLDRYVDAVRRHDVAALVALARADAAG
jgi:RNA polymerase sigma-70 factor (ECF subfamily)